MIKPIAFYLPQFHSIPENDEVWGKGFTEWNSVKAAQKFFDTHQQPRVPLNDNYYNLLNEKTLKWQTELASKNGIYGFCIYHYWFSGKLLLNKPLELLRDSNKIHFPYCICWANESWTNAWKAKGKPKSFLEQKYGDDAEWKAHFEYLLTFFKDSNYIKEENKPLVVIYRPESIPDLNKRLDYWNELAKENGFSGICFAYQQIDFERNPGSDDSRFKYSIEYQPKYALTDYDEQNIKNNRAKAIAKAGIKAIIKDIDNTLNLNILNKRREKNGPRILNYDEIVEYVVNKKARNEKSVAGMFVGYDDTPRKGNRGMVIQSTASQFRKYLFKQMENVSHNYNNDYLFIFAWNEWGESGYLEPDTKSNYQYLNAVKDAVEKYGK